MDRAARTRGVLVAQSAVAALVVAISALTATESGAQEATYADPEARALAAAVRARLTIQENALGSYDVLVRERLSVTLRLPLREHLLYRREMAARLAWRRDGESRVELLGAREYRPRLTGTASALQGAAAEALDLVFVPGQAQATIGIGSFRLGKHPLTGGDSVPYRFASGDTLTIGLADGRQLVLYELRVEPRARFFPAVVGSIWVDAATHAIAQEIYRPLVAPEASGAGKIPGVGRVELRLDRVIIEHGFWEMRWWLPSILTFEGTVQIGRLIHAPFRYERAYGRYELEAAAANDTAKPPAPGAWRVVLPDDRADLLYSNELPASILDGEGPVQSLSPLGAESLLPGRDLPRLGGSGFFATLPTLDMVRYNRVEGASAGVRAGLDGGTRGLDAEARFSTHGRGPDLALMARWERGPILHRLSVHRRLHAMQYEDRPLSAAGSMNSLALGYDDGDYYRVTGGTLEVRSARGQPTWRAELYFEQQRAVPARVDWSLAQLLGAATELRANSPAAPADLVGLRGELGAMMQSSPAGMRTTISLLAEAATGDFEFARGAAVLRAAAPLVEALIVGAEIGMGTSLGSPPPQAHWYLGGPATLRGYDGASLTGDAFWRGRVELGAGSPLVRVIGFYDVAWAGARQTFTTTGRRAAIGAGLSVYDGLLRLDLAHRLSGPRGLRATLAVGTTM